MLRLLNIRDESNICLSVVSDGAYCWRLMDQFIPQMQDLITRDAEAVLKLRAVFQKMSSMMDLSLTRINQAGSPDLVSVSQFYSGELVQFIRTVLQIIPSMLFGILDRIVQIETYDLTEMPNKIMKETLSG